MHVLVKPFHAAGAGNRNDVFPLREHPGKGELGRRCPLLTCDLGDCVRDCEVVLKLLSLETGIASAPVIRSEFV